LGSATLAPAFGALPTPLKILGEPHALLQPAGSPTPPSAGSYTPGSVGKSPRKVGGLGVCGYYMHDLLKVKTSN